MHDNPLNAECLLPIRILGLIHGNQCTVKVLEIKDKWFVVTNKEDKEFVIKKVKNLISKGIYKEDLYSDL